LEERQIFPSVNESAMARKG